MAATVLVGTAPWTVEGGNPQQFGLFRSEAGGDWQRITAGLPEHAQIRHIVPSPHQAGVVYAATQDGPCRSTDGGLSWEALPLPTPETNWSVLVHPADPKVIFAGTVGTNVYRSTDEGNSWSKLEVPAPEGVCEMGFPTRVIRLGIDPSSPDDFYVALEVGGLVASADGGQTWRSCNRRLLEFAQQDAYKSQIGSDTTNEGMMDSHSLAISAARPGTVYLANRLGLWCSEDRGETWTDMDIGRFSPLTYARDVTVSPHDKQVLYGAFSKAARSKEGSLYRSDDLGQSWKRFDHGVNVDSTLMIIAPSQAHAGQVYCASREGKVFGTEDGGISWSERPLPEGVEGVYGLACI